MGGDQDDPGIENLPFKFCTSEPINSPWGSHSCVSREGESTSAGHSDHSTVSREGEVQVQASQLSVGGHIAIQHGVLK